jgi:hypothetical protein
MIPYAMGWGLPDEINHTDAERAFVTIASTEALIPGEHGFRFFPSFYRHLFDTMARTPTFDGTPPVETRTMVLENVKPTYSTGIYFEDGENFELPRRQITSLQSMYDLFVESMSAMGFTGTDIARFSTALFKYMTSSPRRRDDYERMSWWDFIQGERYSPRFRRYLDSSPQFLVAMRGRVSDARTIGNIVVQLLKDNVVGTDRPDGTLSGPTTTAWFDHWRRHLRRHGVDFQIGQLVDFVPSGNDVYPVVEQDGEQQTVVTAYVVVAVPVHVAHALMANRSELRGGDYDRIRAFDVGDPTRPVPGGAVEHMTGIQYYFDSDMKFIAGHTHFPDSAWGLTAIFQPQFWTRPRGWWSGYRGILSVCIADLHTPSPVTRKTAWDSTPDEIAEEVWRQIKATLKHAPAVPEPFLYHLDENLSDASGARENKTPLVINRVGEFHKRPGRPGRYEMHNGRIVFAGTYMQTYTRLTTMEAANESGRHATNAILQAEGFLGDECMVTNPELHEFQDLRWLLQLDDRLQKAGLPHVLDIIGVERVMDLVSDPLALQRVIRETVARLRPRGGAGSGIRLSV